MQKISDNVLLCETDEILPILERHWNLYVLEKLVNIELISSDKVVKCKTIFIAIFGIRNVYCS
jgi:hypothetical protein